MANKKAIKKEEGIDVTENKIAQSLPNEKELNRRFEEFKRKKEQEEKECFKTSTDISSTKPAFSFKFPKIKLPQFQFKRKEENGMPQQQFEKKNGTTSVSKIIVENKVETPKIEELHKKESAPLFKLPHLPNFSGLLSRFKKKGDIIEGKMQEYGLHEKEVKKEEKNEKVKEEKVEKIKEEKDKNLFAKFQAKIKPKSSAVAEKILKEDKKRKLQLLQKKKPVKKTESERRRFFTELIKKSGYELELHKVQKIIFLTSIILTSLGLLLFLFISINKQASIQYISVVSILIATLGFAFTYLLLFGIFFFVVDFRIFQRKLEIEEVLADYLQLTATNIKAGLPIDRALWYSVRPRFGILAKEIEEVAKSTLVGEELFTALKRFADKYDSIILKRSVELLIQGMEAGGEIGDLLEKISLNIQESRIMRREMAANVTTYVIFITFATIIAAPFMFGLSFQMLAVIQSIMSKIDLGSGASGGAMGMPLNFSSDSVSLTDFKIFACASLGISSFFSACIISTIQKGNVKEGLRYIPIFIITSIALFFLAITALGIMFQGMIMQ